MRTGQVVIAIMPAQMMDVRKGLIIHATALMSRPMKRT